MLFLKNYVKYRQERDYVLICDCSIIQNYELPLETLPLLEKLKCGYDPANPLGVVMEQDIIDDLTDLELLDTIPNSNKGFHNQKWVKLGYSENEFFV